MVHAVALVGLGKIARDQHLPSIAHSLDFALAAIVSRSGGLEGVPHFTALEDMLAARPDIGAIALCTPPQVRFTLAAAALGAGRHVLLEKPPGATLAEVDALEALAKARGVTLYATWHSRHAQGVAPARAWLADKEIEAVDIVWREDVRRWHPGQDWIWEPGGLGVFDPGINALSILTEILPEPVRVTRARLEIPVNRHTPIGARIDLRGGTGFPVTADFDWRQERTQTWDIDVATTAGHLKLSQGGAVLDIDGVRQIASDDTEYDGIYAHFARLVATGRSDVDIRPLQLVADAFMTGHTIAVDPFAG